jgi:hypothetical protein
MTQQLPSETERQRRRNRRLSPEDYDAMRTALDSLNRFVRNLQPEKLRKLVGIASFDSVENTKIVSNENNSATENPPIFRDYTDHRACHDCKKKGDKWYMIEHQCSESKVKNIGWIGIKKSQRKAERIRELQRENDRIVG